MINLYTNSFYNQLILIINLETNSILNYNFVFIIEIILEGHKLISKLVTIITNYFLSLKLVDIYIFFL